MAHGVLLCGSVRLALGGGVKREWSGVCGERRWKGVIGRSVGRSVGVASPALTKRRCNNSPAIPSNVPDACRASRTGPFVAMRESLITRGGGGELLSMR